MPRPSKANRDIRRIIRSGNGSYLITIPIEIIRKLKWREKQKVKFNLTDDVIKVRLWE